MLKGAVRQRNQVQVSSGDVVAFQEAVTQLMPGQSRRSSMRCAKNPAEPRGRDLVQIKVRSPVWRGPDPGYSRDWGLTGYGCLWQSPDRNSRKVREALLQKPGDATLCNGNPRTKDAPDDAVFEDRCGFV